MIIRGIFTNTKLSPERMNSETTVPYIVANECPGLKRGDLVQLVGYDSKFQVVWTYASSREQESYETVTISEINGKQINTIGKNISSMEQFGKMDMSDVFGDLTKDMYDDFMPQAEEGAKISITDGVLCFKNSDGAYVGMSPSGKLKKYKMTYPMPCIYNISKNSDQIVIGDIVKSGRSYGVVKAKAEDGSIKIMNFNGNINNKIAIEDECGEDLATSFIYRECAEKWDIYHIHVEHGGYYGVERVSNSWKPYVGDNLIISDKEHVGESIARIVSNSYGQQTNS